MNNIRTLSHRTKEPENGVLYIVGTPIGNLNDLSPRAENILKNVSLIACEDTRRARTIMSKFNISNNLISFNKYNSLNKISKLIQDLKSGNSIALVSDAGMPGICDPGEDLIKETRLEGLEIICIPGPCAVITALVSSGFPCSSFSFEGFLPKKKIDREKLLIEISKSAKTIVFFESPHRLKKSLIEIKKIFGGDREIVITRELTKKYEQHIGRDVNSVLKFFESNPVKGEFTIVVKGIKNQKGTEFDKNKLKNELNELVKAGLSLSAASKYLAKKEKISKNIIYNLH